ncbi:tetraspanin-2-like [Heptranchias perlo]|uniref:tetraspanin-2-like n=1 Tax=Heptranchias perlo TaxID=212740 RepID=UPI00355AA176
MAWSGEERPGVIFAFQDDPGIILQEMSVYYSSSLHTYRTTGTGNRTLRAIHSVLQCCGDSFPDPVIQVLCPTSHLSPNCTSKLKDFFSWKLYMIGVVGIGIAGVMIFGMIFSLVLCCAIRNSPDEM